MSKRIFFYCQICGKKLIERLPNGLWRFAFGRSIQENGKPPVDMQIHGSLKMRCLRRSCRNENPDHWNVLNFFPHTAAPKPNRQKDEQKKSISNGATEESGINNETKNNGKEVK